MYYDRKIRYFEYKKDGIRLPGKGFLKAEVRGNACDILIRITGVHASETFTGPVYAVSGAREEVLCEITLQGGRGSRQLRLSGNNLANGLSYEDLNMIRIPIVPGGELVCLITEERIKESESGEIPVGVSGDCDVQDAESESEHLVLHHTEQKMEQSKMRHDTREVEQSKMQHNAQEVVQPKMQHTGQEEMAQEQSSMMGGEPPGPCGEVNEPCEELIAEEEKEEPLYETLSLETSQDKSRDTTNNIPCMQEDKWLQLCTLYPHICPFGDTREYLRFRPEDFVILNHRHYRLVHNSFLLHGFYNYNHLILARLEKRGEVLFYIGVPGSYYNREKQVAVMYGFESFECREEPAAPGEYGYYMIRVEL